MPFHRLSLLTSLVFATLCLTLIFVPDLIYWLFRLPAHDSADALAKRAAMLFLGLAVLCFGARKSALPELRRLVALSVGVAMAAMAVLGLYELARGVVGPGILLAVGAELALAGLYLMQWLANRRG